MKINGVSENTWLVVYGVVIAPCFLAAAFYDLKPVHPFHAVGEIYERGGR